MRPTIPGIDVLLLCTANQCRSPMAERLLRHRLGDADVHVSSGGRLAGGVVASAGGVRALAPRGLDLTDHLSRQVGPPEYRAADLIVVMAREHVRDAVSAAPDVFGRCFTLRELVRRAEERGGRGPDETLADWLARMGAGRRPADLLGSSRSDDVEDPIGRSDARYRECADLLENLLDRLVTLGRLDQ